MTHYEADVELGVQYRDKQTGITGVATAITFYQHGCERVNLEAVIDRKIEEYSFDSPRLVRVADEKRVEPSGRPGGAQPMVPRPRDGASVMPASPYPARSCPVAPPARHTDTAHHADHAGQYPMDQAYALEVAAGIVRALPDIPIIVTVYSRSTKISLCTYGRGRLQRLAAHVGGVELDEAIETPNWLRGSGTFAGIEVLVHGLVKTDGAA